MSMSDLAVSSDSTTAAQAYDLAQQTASEKTHKMGNHVVGYARDVLPAGALGATTATGDQSLDAIGGVASHKQSKAAINPDAPQLPDPIGEVASPAKALESVAGSVAFASDGAGLFAALNTAYKANQENEIIGMNLARVQGQNEMGAKVKELHDKEAQIEGDKKSAATTFAGSIIGFTAAFAMGVVGSRIERSTPNPSSDAADEAGKAAEAAQKNESNPLHGKFWKDRQAMAAGMRNSGMAVGGLIDSIFKMGDINVGGLHDSNQAQLEQKQDQVEGKNYENKKDAANKFWDDAKEKRKSALEAIMSHLRMWLESSVKVFS